MGIGLLNFEKPSPRFDSPTLKKKEGGGGKEGRNGEGKGKQARFCNTNMAI